MRTDLRKDKKERTASLGVPLVRFRFLFKKVNETIAVLDKPSVPSPYSIIPLISQAMGLDVPMMGSGRSPYSVISYCTELERNIFVGETKDMPYQERRELVDEVYDMIAPYLLGEEREYIDLLIKTKYKKVLKGLNKKQIEDMRRSMERKFKIMASSFSKIEFTGGNFSHIAHYGYLDDLYREQSFLKDMENEAAELWRKSSYPIVTEMRLDGYDAPNKCIVGWYIFVPNYTEELLRSRTLRQKKLLQAGKIGRALDAKFSGMAGLIASFSKGGRILTENVKDFGFTTGHSYTVANIYSIFTDIVSELGINLLESKLAVVGASGSIGSGISKMLSQNDIRELLIIDKANMVSSHKLNQLKSFLEKENPKNKIRLSKNVSDIKDSDVIVVATNSTESIIESDFLKPGAVVIDDSFPKNVSRETFKRRPDIILLEGGVSQMPRVNIDVARHMPDLLDLSISKLISCCQAYGCLAETFILAASGHTGNFGIGDADPALAHDIMAMGQDMFFSSATFQNYGFAIERSRIERVKKLVKQRN